MSAVFAKCPHFQSIKRLRPYLQFSNKKLAVLTDDCGHESQSLYQHHHHQQTPNSLISNDPQYFPDLYTTWIKKTQTDLIVSTNKVDLQKVDYKKNWSRGSTP